MLNGNLNIFPLPDVLRVVATREVTGRVIVTRPGVSGELVLDKGRIVSAALAGDEPPVNEDEAIDVAVVLLEGNGGTFEVFSEEWAGGPLDLDPEALVTAADARREAWADILERIGALDEPPFLSPELPDDVGEVTLDGNQWRLVRLIDGFRTVPGIAREAGMSVFATASALAELETTGLLTKGVKRAKPDRSPERFIGGAAGGGDGADLDPHAGLGLEPVGGKKGTIRR